MKKQVGNFTIENNGEVLKGTDALLFSLSVEEKPYLGEKKLGHLTFKDNVVPEDEALLECCMWKAHQEEPWNYSFEGFKVYDGYK